MYPPVVHRGDPSQIRRPHEFDQEQNKVFVGLSESMKVAGTILLVLGILALVSVITNTALKCYIVSQQNAVAAARANEAIAFYRESNPNLASAMEVAAAREQVSYVPWIIIGVLGAIGALIPINMGRSLRTAADSFRAIVRTAGDDIERFMDAVKELTGVYSLGRILTIYSIAIGIIVGVWTLRLM
jgi:hypothetical protein